MKSTSTSTRIVPRIYGYILILFGIFLSNVSALPIMLKRDGETEPEDPNKQKLISKVIGAIAVIAGFCICFFGHQMYNKLIFFIGFICGVMITKAFFDSVWSDCSNVVVYIMGVIIGILFGTLATCAYKISLAFVGALTGYFVAAIIIAFIPVVADKINPFLLAVILAIIFIILIYVFEKPIVIIATGIIGSYMLFYGIDTIVETGLARAVQTMYNSQSFEAFESSLSVRVMIIASILVAILGWVVQFITYNKNKDDY